MTKVREKAQGRTKQIVGQMISDDLLVEEGKEQERKADEPAEGEAHDEPSDDRGDRPARGS